MKTKSAIEPLESRIAPAALFVNATTATYSDADGDLVTVKFSKPILTAANVGTVVFTTFATALGESLHFINFTGLAAAEGTNITVTAKPQIANADTILDGDGLANVGQIRAAGIDLGAVSIKGTLGSVDAGNANTKTPGVKSLAVQSLGVASDIIASTQSNIVGPLGKLTVAGDVRRGAIIVTGTTPADGQIGAVTIGGSLIGLNAFEGNIFAAGNIGPVKIGRDIVGGSGGNSGLIQSDGKIASVSVGGDVAGGGGQFSGAIRAASMGAVKIGGDLAGSSGPNSGSITSLVSAISAVTVGGSVLGGTGNSSGFIGADGVGFISAVTIGDDLVGGGGFQSGTITADQRIGKIVVGGSVLAGRILASCSLVKVGGDVTGGILFGVEGAKNVITVGGSVIGGATNSSGALFCDFGPAYITIGGDLRGGDAGATDLSDTGIIRTPRLASLTIGGDIIAGRETGAGQLTRSGGVFVFDDIGSVLVKGSLIGNTGNPVFISAEGSEGATAKSDVAIGKLTVLGRVERAQILAGYNADLDPSNADAQIGTVKVGGEWFLSDLVAGARAGGNGAFGDGDDAKISGAGVKDTADATLISRIASITIGGAVVGTIGGADHFGFVAQQIGALKIAGTAIPLLAGASNDNRQLGAADDVHLREI